MSEVSGVMGLRKISLVEVVCMMIVLGSGMIFHDVNVRDRCVSLW